MERRIFAYWITTALFCAVLGFSGFAHVTHREAMVEAMTGMGYPLYFMTIIGTAKLLGVAALLAPQRPLLKEWAYAGLAFNLMGATASHGFSGDGFSHAIRPALVLLVGVASYLLRPADRRLSASPSVAEDAHAAGPAAAASAG